MVLRSGFSPAHFQESDSKPSCDQPRRSFYSMIKIRRSTLTLLSTGLLAFLTLSPQIALAQSPSPHAVSMYNLGLNAYKQGSPESAIIFFKRAADLDPNLADAQYNLGVLYQSQRRLKEAIPRFQEVLRVKPGDADAHFQLGVTYMGLASFPEAISELNTIAPSNSHFQEAQRKVQECNQKIAAGQGGAATPVQPGDVRPQLPTTPGQPEGTPPADQTGMPPTAPSAESPQGFQQPPTQPPYIVTAPTSQPPETARQPEASPPSGGGEADSSSSGERPTAVLANASVKIIATGFQAPSGLTFDKFGNLYVANFNSNTVDRIGLDGSRSQFCQGGHLKGPIGLVSDDIGNIYVSNYSSGTIARITPAGISSIIATGFKQPYYLTLDKTGNLFISQQSDNTIIKVSLPRTLTSRTASEVTP